MLESGSGLPSKPPFGPLRCKAPSSSSCSLGSALASLTFTVLERKPSLYLILFS